MYSAPKLLPYARHRSRHVQQLEAPLSQPRPHRPLCLAAGGESDVVLTVQVNGQAEGVTIHTAGGEVESV